MKTKHITKANLEVLDLTQLSKVKGGRTAYIIVDGKLIEIEIPD